MSDALRTRLIEEAECLAVASETLPLWTDHGISDYSCTIHSTGVTYWTLLGRALGYQALAEMPAPSDGRYGHVGDDVRSDSVWFDRDSQEPIVLVEFERYVGPADTADLTDKVKNLLLAHHRWGGVPKVLVLAYWTKSLATLPNHRVLKKLIRSGFETGAKEKVIGTTACQLAIFQTVLRETPDGKWRLWQMIERGTA